MHTAANLLIALVAIIAIAVLFVVVWHWDAKRTARRSSRPGLPRTLAEHRQRRRAL